MKIAVTGAGGFIGSYVMEELRCKGIEPVGVDHYRPGSTQNQWGDWFSIDIRDAAAVEQVISNSDRWIHLAGILGTAETISDPWLATETNIRGALNVFRAAAKHDKPGVNIAVGNHWMNNTYSISKSTVERFVEMFNTESGTNILNVRALNAYGPRQKSRPVRKIIPNFIAEALANKPITVFGSGEQIMDCVHVKDVANILVRACQVAHLQYTEPTFDAGTGRPTTVNDIAQMVIDACGSKAGICHVDMRQGEPADSVVLADPSTLGLLGGHKFITLEDGLVETVAWYKDLQ